MALEKNAQEKNNFSRQFYVSDRNIINCTYGQIKHIGIQKHISYIGLLPCNRKCKQQTSAKGITYFFYENSFLIHKVALYFIIN